MYLLLKIFLAHLIGDFLLQPNSWVEAKENKKLRSWQLYAHGTIHFLLMVILIGKFNFIIWALLLAVIHLIIDAFKITRKKSVDKRVLFFADQGFHIFSIILIGFLYLHKPLPIHLFNRPGVLLFTTLIIFLTVPASLAIKIFISKWAPHTEDRLDDSLQNAGKYIGILERLLIFIFILINQWSGVGFLLAAKSIFRFGDLKEAKDRKLTEYILIGTLLSFGLAIVAGLLYQILIRVMH